MTTKIGGCTESGCGCGEYQANKEHPGICMNCGHPKSRHIVERVSYKCGCILLNNKNTGYFEHAEYCDMHQNVSLMSEAEIKRFWGLTYNC